jgi:hypothetical protein
MSVGWVFASVSNLWFQFLEGFQNNQRRLPACQFWSLKEKKIQKCFSASSSHLRNLRKSGQLFHERALVVLVL